MTHLPPGFMSGEEGHDITIEQKWDFSAPLKFSTHNAELRDVRKQSREAWVTRALLGKRIYRISPWGRNIQTTPERIYGNLTLSLEKITRGL